MPDHDQRLRIAAAVLVVAAGCGGGGTTAPPTSTTTSSSTTTSLTTTTLSEDERRLQAIAGFTTEEEAQFRLFSNPPEFPGDLDPLDTVVEPLGEPIPIVRTDTAGVPVVDEEGRERITNIRLDGLGRLVAGEDGIVRDDRGNPVAYDAAGAVLLAVQFDEAGLPVVEEGRIVTERVDVLPPDRVLVIGDSVILSAGPSLGQAFEGWHTIVDAVERRLPGHGDDTVRTHVDDIGRVVIVMLGHNVGSGETHIANIRTIQQSLDDAPNVDRVVWVSAAELGAPQLEWNEALRAYVDERRAADEAAPGQRPTVHFLDWALYNAVDAELTYDGLHLTLEGRDRIAGLLAEFVGAPPDCAPVIGTGPAAGTCP